MQKQTGIKLLQSVSLLNKEIQVLERQIRDQTAAMQGLTSMRITDMPKGKPLPAGMDKVLANKDELEIVQRQSMACLYEQLREAELLLQGEINPEMRMVMRIVYVENQPLSRAAGILHMSVSTVMRLKDKVKQKYEKVE